MKERKRKLLMPILFVAIGALSMLACSQTLSTGGGTLKVSGKIAPLARSLHINALRDAASAGEVEVAVYPVVDARIVGNVPYQTASVSTDGSFSLSLPTSYTGTANSGIEQQPGAELPAIAGDLGHGYVLLVTNPGATSPKDRVDGVIALNDGAYHIVDMPTAAAKGDLDLGQLTQNLDEEQSALSVLNVFDLSESQLASYSLLDDVFKDAKNIYCNHDTSGDYEMHPQFMWHLNGMSALAGSWTPVDSLVYEGYTMEARTDKTSLDQQGIASGTVPVTLVPPSAITIQPLSNGSPSTVTQISNSGMVDAGYHSSDRTDWISADGLMNTILWNDGRMSIGISGRVQDKSIASGWWSLVDADDNHIADFDLGCLTPYDAAGNYRFFFPSVKLTVDSSNYVSQVDVRWYMYDTETGQYVDKTGSAEFAHIVTGWFLSFCDEDGTDSNGGKRIDFRPAIGQPLPETWKYYGDQSTTDPVISFVQVCMTVGSSVLGNNTSIGVDFH